MSRGKSYGAFALILTFAVFTVAQTSEIDDPVQLTFSVAGTMNYFAFPAWNGSEWGTVYTRIYGEATIHALLCTEYGDIIESHELLGKVKDYGYFTARISAYEKGWAVTAQQRSYKDQMDDRAEYFILLNKKARKTGVQVTLFSHQYGVAVRPIPVGDMFVVFYAKPLSNGFLGIFAAYIDWNGNRVIPDVQVTTQASVHYYPLFVTPTSEGFALMGVTFNAANDAVSDFYTLVDLDGTQIVKPKMISNNGTYFFPQTAVWNGQNLAVAGIENLGFEDDKYAPFSRFLALDGTWQGGSVRHLPQSVNGHHGLGYDGNNYVAMISNLMNGTVWCQELDQNLHSVGQKVETDGSAYVDLYSRAKPAGSLTGFFGCLAKVQGGKTINLYYTRIVLPHEGKPDIAFFNGKVHEFNGKSYALLDWVTAGCRQIRMKTKGGRWTLPPSGFHAVEITKTSKFKIIASNDSGSSKSKIKIAP